MSNISQWNTTADSNNSASPNGAPEGMSPAGVNNVIRENMAAAAKQYKDTKGGLVTGGTGTAYTLTTNNVHTAIGDIGLTVCRINTVNTGSATLSVDSLTAKTLQIKGANLVAGDLPQDVLIVFAYNSTNDTFDVLSVGRENLEDIAALTHADGTIIVSDGTNWVAETGATARTSLGVAIGSDVQAHDSVLDSTTASYTTAEESKLAGIEASADVTDATNVNAAGATMNTDTDVSGNDWVIDEDAMESNSSAKVPTQQSVKAYVDDTVTAIGALSVTGTPVTDDYARFTGSATIEGRSASEARGDLGLGSAAQVNTGTASGNVPLVGTKSATETLAGLVEKSTSAENIAGTDDTVYPTVAGAKEMIDTHATGETTSLNYQEFTSSGTWTKPAGAISVYVEGIGGGGGGENETGANPAIGGDGGEFSCKTYAAGDLGATEAVVVGAGGAGGAAGANNFGATGGNSTFDDLTAYGGECSLTPTSAPSMTSKELGVGGYAAGRAAPTVSSSQGGGSVQGGGGGGSVDNSPHVGNSGGVSIFGGNGGDGDDNGGGGNGTAPGGGGGGAGDNDGGGDGGDGIIRVWTTVVS